MQPPSGLAPNLINFIAVQVLYHVSKPRLFGGRYVHLDTLPAASASAYLIGALLGRTAKVGWVDLFKMFSDQPDSAEAIRGVVDSLRARVEERLRVYADINPDGWKKPNSFFHYVAWTTSGSLASMGRQGRFVPVDQPGGQVELRDNPARAGVPRCDSVDPAAICTSGAKVSYDSSLVGAFLGMLVAEGIALGSSKRRLVDRMAANDVEVDMDEWAEARDRGLGIPEQPPFCTLADLAEALEKEAEWFRGSCPFPSTGPVREAPARLSLVEYQDWTQRLLGQKVMSLYMFHTAMGLVEEMSREKVKGKVVVPGPRLPEFFLQTGRTAVDLAKRVYGFLGLAGVEASLYRGPSRPGFVHDVRSVIQRPDLYELTAEQRFSVRAIQRGIDQSLIYWEQVLVWDRTRVPPPALDVIDLFDQDLYWSAVPGIGETEAQHAVEPRPGYWPQYVDLARAVRAGLLTALVDASGDFRKFSDVFHAWDATQGRLRFGDPWQDLVHRFEDGAKAIAAAEILLPKEELELRNAALRNLAEAAESAEKRQ